MSDDNIERVLVTSDGKLTRERNLPKPGSDEWVKAIIRNIILEATSDRTQIEQVISIHEHEGLLPLLYQAWLGDLLELLVLPVEEYHEKARSRLPEELPADNGENDEASFAVGTLSDLIRSTGKDQEFVNRVINKLTRGQAYTFYFAIADSFREVALNHFGTGSQNEPA